MFFNLAIAVIALCIVGYMGYYDFTKATDDTDSMYSNSLLPILWLNDSRTQTRVIQVDLMDLILTNDKSIQQQLIKDIDERTKVLNDNLAHIEKSLIEPTEKEKLNELKAGLEKYRESGKLVIDLAIQNKDEEAYKLFNSCRPLMEAFNKQLRELSKMQIEEVTESNKLSKANAKKDSILLLTIITVSIVIVLGFGWYIAKLIQKNLDDVTKHLGVIAQGDFSIDVPQESLQQKDEFGLVARAFDAMQNNMRNLICQLSQTSEQLAASAEEMSASAEQSAQTLNLVACSITETAQGAEKQSSELSNALALVGNVSRGNRDGAEACSEAVKLTSKAVQANLEGNEATTTVIRQMASIQSTVNNSAKVVTELGERSEEIGQIVETISNIAGQTNLLALNAAIEAARAGEHGRGFAVVAEEVRKLAEQAAEAARQIEALVKGIQESTASAVAAMTSGTTVVAAGTQLVAKVEQTFKEIEAYTNQYAGISQMAKTELEKLAYSSQEALTAMEVINKVSKDIVGQAQTVSAATEEQSASMEQIASSSQSLAKLAEELQVAIQKFKV